MRWEAHISPDQRGSFPELYEIEKSAEVLFRLRNGRHTVPVRVHALRRVDAEPDERYCARYEVLVNGIWREALLPPKHRPTADVMIAQALADLTTGEYPTIQGLSEHENPFRR